jgi:2-polyprenyl-3-methyl-5-hydroxy-6-metoxy-1,4-benzoquinol methylase
MKNLKVKDYTVSNEIFELKPNPEFGFLETYPQPRKDLLSSYYNSTDYISHTNTKRNLFEASYQIIRKWTLLKKLKLVNSYGYTNKTILDVGCGTGHFLSICQKSNWHVTGIEPNTNARTIANKATNNSVHHTNELPTLEKSSFDIITLWHVLEHLPDLEKQISLFKSLLRPNGRLIIAVPNHKSFDAKYYNSFWAAYDVPRHLWHFNTPSLSKLMLKYGLQLDKKLPMWFDSIYVSLLSEKNKSGHMNIIKALAIGLWSNIKSLSTNQVSSHTYVFINDKNPFK